MIEIVTAEEFAAVTEPSAEPLIGDRETNLLSAGALAVVYGDGGAGKTTLFLDFAFHLATGRAWLELEIPVRRRVLWLENEGPRGNFREKIDAKIHAWDGAALDGHLRVLEEPWAAFSFADELHRRAIAQVIVDYEIDVLIVGPVQTLGIQGGGTPAEVNEFVELVEATRQLVGRPVAIVLIHHENRAGQISGAWERVPDTLVHVTAQGHGKTRLYWQKARWASDLHGKAWALTWQPAAGFEREERPVITPDSIADAILAAVAEHPGASWRKLRDLHHDGQKRIRGKLTDVAEVRDRLIATGQLVNAATRSGQFELWRPDDPAAPGSPAGTTWEPLTFPPAATSAEPDRFPVPAIEGNQGNRNGNGGPQIDENDHAGTFIDEDELERLAALADDLEPHGGGTS